MQPYFIPYAGYFRLLAAADLFVVYDCVQFPRRGWVHRNCLPDATGRSRWLTLPLARLDRDAKIRELAFRDDAAAALHDACAAFPLLSSSAFLVSEFHETFRGIAGRTPVTFIVRLLEEVAGALAIPFDIVRSSALAIDPALAGQDRILAIARAVGATTYVNAPGGRDLYQHDAFGKSGIRLRFLPPWRGSPLSILQQLLTRPPADVAADIRQQAVLEE